MKKKLVAILCVVIALILLVPIPGTLKDGGTKEYTAILYKISDVHALTSLEDMAKGKEFYEGIIVEILGFEVYNNVK